MLWDVIRDFFVMYIFGGYASDGISYDGSIGGGDWYINDLKYNFNNFDVLGNDFVYSIGDWLSTTFTIITLILICYMFLRITIWLFKFGAGLFKW